MHHPDRFAVGDPLAEKWLTDLALRFRFTTILAVIAVTLAALVVGVCIGTKVFAGSDKICRGVVVSGIDLSGMTNAQAEEA